jgi:hypothetical protein
VHGVSVSRAWCVCSVCMVLLSTRCRSVFYCEMRVQWCVRSVCVHGVCAVSVRDVCAVCVLRYGRDSLYVNTTQLVLLLREQPSYPARNTVSVGV